MWFGKHLREAIKLAIILVFGANNVGRFAMWFGKNEKQLEWEHLERMKCLEQGLPLPDADLAWAKIVEQRGQQLTGVLIVGTIFLTGAPVGLTAIILALGRQMPALGLIALLAVVWCASAFVLLCLTRYAMAGLLHLKRSTQTAPPRPTSQEMNALKLVPHEEEARPVSSEAIKASWFARPVVVDEE
jgi:hypothetical protein